MPFKTFLTLVGLLATAAVAVLLTLLEARLWLVLVVGCGVIALVGWWTHDAVMRGESFVHVRWDTRQLIWKAITLAACAHVAVLAYVLLTPGEWKTHAFWLIGLSLTELLVASGWDWRIGNLVHSEPSTEVEVYVPTLEDNDQPHLQTADQVFQRILARGGWPHVLVARISPLPDGHKGATFECRALSAQAASELAGKEISKVEALGLGQEERLALAAEEELGIDLETRWVRIQGTSRPGRVRVTVATEDIYAKPLPYPLNNEMLPRGSQIQIGTQVHGDPVMLNPYQHIVICGPTQSGKTSLVNVVIAELLRLPGRVQLCGAEKVYDIAGQWLDPHLGTDNDLPLDWVVEGQADSLKMLAGAMHEARWRQNLEHHDRTGIDPLWVVVEEAPRVLNDKTMTVTVEGMEYFASELVAHNTRTTTSSEVYFILLAQEFDNAMFGDAAASIKANSNCVILMRSRSGDERSRAFGRGGAAQPDLHNSGEFYIQDASDPFSGKSHYIQEMDPRKPRLHDGPTLNEVSVARAALVGARSQGRTAPPSIDYAERPRRMTAEYRHYLQGKRRTVPAGQLPAAVKQADPATLVADMIARVEAELDERDGITPKLSVVQEATSKPRMREFVVSLLDDKALTQAEILAALHEAGYETTKSSLENALSDLAGKNRISRGDGPDGKRIYRAA